MIGSSWKLCDKSNVDAIGHCTKATSLNGGEAESRVHYKKLILEKEISSSEAITLSNHFVALGRNEKW